MLSNNTNKSNQRITITISITKAGRIEIDTLRNGYGTSTILYILRKAMDKFQYTWITIINKIHELIVEYLGNRLR